MFAELGVAVAHCPTANSYFSSAVAPSSASARRGDPWNSTDISGGYSPSMYENIRQAVLVSRLLETGVNAQLPPEARREPARAHGCPSWSRSGWPPQAAPGARLAACDLRAGARL